MNQALRGVRVPLTLAMVAVALTGLVETRGRDAWDPCKRLSAHPRARKLVPRCGLVGSSAGVARGDFNGDGVADLAVGAPYDRVGGAEGGGSVNVFYGSATGLTADALDGTGQEDQFLSQDEPGIPGGAESGDRFGSALASGDFDGDGFADLAIGIPGENLDGVNDKGAVLVVYGASEGLDTGRTQFWDAADAGVSNCRTHPLGFGDGCRFGAALVWGDFNDDGRGDLVVGMPDQGIVTPRPAEEGGQVVVLYGTGDGLSAANRRTFPAWRPLDPFDGFGEVLAAGDLNGDDYDDLAVGVPSAALRRGLLPSLIAAGEVRIFYGGFAGLDEPLIPDSDQLTFLTQDTSGVDGVAEQADLFGRALAIGDFDNDGYGDLVVGVPYEDVGNVQGAGIVHVFRGSSHGVSTADDQIWDQSRLNGVVAEAGDHFGAALAVGRFNDGAFQDLAIGVPDEDIGSLADSGLVHILYGSDVGLVTYLFETWTLGGTWLPGAAAGDRFGSKLSAWNFGRSSHSDLAIGIPGRNVSGVANAGAVLVLYGTVGGPNASSSQFWHRDVAGVKGTPGDGDGFGGAMY
jgi:hypothetical protein